MGYDHTIASPKRTATCPPDQTGHLIPAMGDTILTAVNGHSVPLINAPAQPEPEYGSTVEIEPKKLGIEGNQMLGQIQALSRWQAMFAAYAAKTLDIRERQVLLEVAKALGQNAEQFKVTLSQLAIKRNAAKITPVDPDDDEGTA